VAVLTIPAVPYRCPPGPYERACLIADWMRVRKPQAKLIVLDANPDFVTEKDNFSRAFFDLHGQRDRVPHQCRSSTASTRPADAVHQRRRGARRRGQPDPAPARPQLLADAGLLNATGGRFAAVDVLSYASTAAPSCARDRRRQRHHPAQGRPHRQPGGQGLRRRAGAPLRRRQPRPGTGDQLGLLLDHHDEQGLVAARAVFQYDAASASMKPVAAGSGASVGWNGDHFEDMGTWFTALMADTFA
jgi:sulfide dehydrogenase [flavocytochrome c] flavoprotein subunit